MTELPGLKGLDVGVAGVGTRRGIRQEEVGGVQDTGGGGNAIFFLLLDRLELRILLFGHVEHSVGVDKP